MCILVRYFDECQGNIIVQLLDLIKPETDCTTESLYTHFKACILSYDIPYKNVIGICYDSKYNSFTSRLINDIPDVVSKNGIHQLV